MCVSKQIKSGCSQRPKCHKVTRVQPKRYCGKHTHVCCRMINLRVSHKGQRLQRIAHHLLLRAHTCVLQTKSTQSCTEGQGLRRLGRPNAPTGHTPVCCRMYQFRGCTQESRVTTEWQTHCCCENTHVCRRIDQPKVAPENQGLQGFWPTNCCRERNHTHTHARVAENANSGLHPRIKGYEALANDVLL